MYEINRRKALDLVGVALQQVYLKDRLHEATHDVPAGNVENTTLMGWLAEAYVAGELSIDYTPREGSHKNIGVQWCE